LAHYPFGVALSCAIGVAGLAIGMFYEWRKTLVAAVVLHASVNAVGMAVMMASISAEAAAPKMGVWGEPGKQGCVLAGLAPGSSAERAGLRVNDVVTAVDEIPVHNILDIRQVVRRKRVGESVFVEFIRDGKTERARVVLTRLAD
jgi:S1-C subfamily serine protease